MELQKKQVAMPVCVSHNSDSLVHMFPLSWIRLVEVQFVTSCNVPSCNVARFANATSNRGSTRKTGACQTHVIFDPGFKLT